MRHFSEGELWAAFGIALVLGFFGFSGSAIYFTCASSSEEAKAKAAAIQSLSESGKSSEEIQEIMLTTYDKGSKKTVGDKRSDLAQWLVSHSVSASEIPKIVDACFKDEDFANIKKAKK